jgi:hypothetical protein
MNAVGFVIEVGERLLSCLGRGDAYMFVSRLGMCGRAPSPYMNCAILY